MAQMNGFEGRVGQGLSWMSPQRRSVAVRNERLVDECRERGVEIM